jgi:hypothetical protein
MAQGAAAELDPLAEAPLYAEAKNKPKKFCDLVMKGGVTSGIVYPRAVCELAQEFRFRNIGGTSAGAIAAAGTAAAELRRRRDGSGEGFAGVARLPAELAENERLFQLFQPQPRTRALFDVLAAYTYGKKCRKRRVAWAVLRGYKWKLLLGALPGVLLLVWTWLPGGKPYTGDAGSWMAVVPEILLLLGFGALAAVGAIVAASVDVITCIRTAIPQNYYGLTTGLTKEMDPGKPSLTRWLHHLLNRLAGIDDLGHPLTFGDLWVGRLKDGKDDRAWDDKIKECLRDLEKRAVKLEMVTTCITQGRPCRLPIESSQTEKVNMKGQKSESIFYFCADEFLGDDLKQEIEALAARHLIPDASRDWARELRGGETLLTQPEPHTGVTKQDAEELLALAESVLEYLYMVPALVRERRARLTTS